MQIVCRPEYLKLLLLASSGNGNGNGDGDDAPKPNILSTAGRSTTRVTREVKELLPR